MEQQIENLYECLTCNEIIEMEAFIHACTACSSNKLLLIHTVTKVQD